jgi:DNA-binding MarR family transcriptional regulator
MGKHMEKCFSEKINISFSQFWVIHCFNGCKEDTEITAVKVAKKMFVTEATVSRHIEKLERMKLIHKERDKTNKRKFLVNLTNKGLEEYDEGKKIIAEELKKIFEAISVHEKQQIIKSLEKVIEKLK